MVECPFSGKEFDSKHEMHLHWREHWDELNSHQKDKVKKAERKKKEEKDKKLQERKQKAGYGLAAAGGIALLAVIGIQLMQMTPAGSTLEDAEFDDRPVLGEADAPVTIVEFGDYLCPACKSFEDGPKSQLMSQGYFDRGEVNFYYFHFPVVDQVASTNAGAAAECVADQDQEQFWNFHDALFDNQQQINYNTEGLVGLAQTSTEGLDYERLEQCIDNQEKVGVVSDHQSLGSSNQVSSTPTVFVNGERVGDWSDLQQIVDNRLEEEE